MELIKLIAGIGLLSVFLWLLFRNARRKGFLHAWLRLEMVVGIIAGLYLIISSTVTLLR